MRLNLRWPSLFHLLFGGVLLLATPLARAQAASSLLADRQALLDAFIAERVALQQEQETLIAKGATQEQLEAWTERNASRLLVQQQRAQQIALQAALDQMSSLTSSPTPPPGASPTLVAALAARTRLANARAQMHNQLIQSMPADATAEEISQMQELETQLFVKKWGAEMASQIQRTQTLSDGATVPIQPLPPASLVPPGASPQWAASLFARDQLSREEIQLRNQYGAASSAVQQAALRQWREQNAGRLRQLQELVGALPPTS